jgi:hypothetical protein
MAELASLDVYSNKLVLSLIDLRKPLFQRLTEGLWEFFKAMFQWAGSPPSVTSGRHGKDPLSKMLVRLIRSALNEILGTNVQIVDWEGNAQSVSALAKAVLQFTKLIKLRPEGALSDILYILEPEISFQAGDVMAIPHLKQEVRMNRRYSSSRGLIETAIQTTDAFISQGSTRPGSYLRKNDIMEKEIGEFIHRSV